MQRKKPSPPRDSIYIRQAIQADLPALEWEGEYIHYRRLYSDTYYTVKQGNGVIWIAENGIGYLLGQVFVLLKGSHPEMADGSSRAYVYGFRVRPEYRSHGIGTRLMQTVENDLAERGFSVVTLNVGQDNAAARRFYERLGYEVVSVDPGFWSYIDHLGKRVDVHEPAWRMEKVLRDDRGNSQAAPDQT